MRITLTPYFIFLFVMSLITLLVYVSDYSTAKNKRGRVRIPEYVLLILTSLGGAIGAVIATLITRHKTRKLSFKIVIFCSLIIEVATAILLFI